MNITFPGGKRVNAEFDQFTVKTDQSVKDGGDGSAPEPYDIFSASIGTCAGIYVLSFCRKRNIDTENLKMSLRIEKNPKTYLIETMTIHISLPSDFPDKYKASVIRAAELCTVKRTIENPPAFHVIAEIQED